MYNYYLTIVWRKFVSQDCSYIGIRDISVFSFAELPTIYSDYRISATKYEYQLYSCIPLYNYINLLQGKVYILLSNHKKNMLRTLRLNTAHIYLSVWEKKCQVGKFSRSS